MPPARICIAAEVITLIKLITLIHEFNDFNEFNEFKAFNQRHVPVHPLDKHTP